MLKSKKCEIKCRVVYRIRRKEIHFTKSTWSDGWNSNIHRCRSSVETVTLHHLVQSTLRQSRPNKAGLKCLSVRAYVCTSGHPQKVSMILTKFGMQLEVDEWCMTVCSMKSGHFKKLFPPPLTMVAGNWPRNLKLGHNIYILWGQIFYICPSFCVTWLNLSETSVVKSRPSVLYGPNFSILRSFWIPVYCAYSSAFAFNLHVFMVCMTLHMNIWIFMPSVQVHLWF